MYVVLCGASSPIRQGEAAALGGGCQRGSTPVSNPTPHFTVAGATILAAAPVASEVSQDLTENLQGLVELIKSYEILARYQEVMLEVAATASQKAPHKPGTGGCGVIICTHDAIGAVVCNPTFNIVATAKVLDWSYCFTSSQCFTCSFWLRSHNFS